MFHFSVNSKELLDVDLNELAQGGIVVDHKFQEEFIKEFASKKHPTETEAEDSNFKRY